MDAAASNKRKTNIKKEIFDWLELVVFSMVIVVLVYTFVFRVVGVDGDSMLQTLHDRDRLIITSLFYEPKAKDIVVITQPWEENKPIIKRIIATEGQTVDIDDSGKVTVDGEVIDEPYTSGLPTYPLMQSQSSGEKITYPLTVEEGKVFVMGDNRINSEDSRSNRIGQIDVRYIMGKAVFRLYPFDKIGKLS